jgi:hypothetical protein
MRSFFEKQPKFEQHHNEGNRQVLQLYCFNELLAKLMSYIQLKIHSFYIPIVYRLKPIMGETGK